MSIQVGYHREGDGPALVLLHGVGHHWQAWRPVIERLAGEFDVIAADTPGFGTSPPLPSGMEPTVTSHADAFEWFFAEAGLQRPHVAGNSMGGAIALELARRKAVSSVTAFSPAGFWTAAERRFTQLSLLALARTPPPLRPMVAAAARTRPGRIALFSQTFGYPGRLPAEEAVATLRDAWASPVLAKTLAAFDAYSFQRPEQLRAVPVTIAWGRRDRLLPYRLQAPRAKAMLPWATHLELGAGHVPFYDDPPACSEAIRTTVRAVERVPAGGAAAG